VQVGEIIIDITADQFSEEIDIPVIVTRMSNWHKQFKGKRSGLQLEGELMSDYKTITSKI
jgi:hypothetical protein